jgi:hypothetical protein
MVYQWFGLKTTGTVSHWFGLQNRWRWFVSGLASKSLGWFSPVWPQNRWRWFLPVWPQNRQLRFGDFSLKITAKVSWFGPQNQAGFGLSVTPQNQRREVGAGHASRSSGLLHVKASLARVSQSGLKTDGGAMMDGARGTIVEVAPEAS